MTRQNRNLVLVHRGVEYEKDFAEIAEKVNALDRSITIYHLPMWLDADLPVSAWRYPTLTVALNSTFSIPIRRGPILKNTPIGKLRQQEIFRANGIDTPPAMPFHFGMKLDPIVFGEFVVLKPSHLDLTSQGTNVHLFRRRRAEQLQLNNFPLTHPLQQDPRSYIVQRFIDTGAYPKYYRVATFMGKILYAWQTSLIEKRPEMTDTDDAIEKAIVDIKGGTMRRTLIDCDPILETASKVAAAFDAMPLLGIDFVVDEHNQKIWVLEVNAGGNTWHFSSNYGKDLRVYFGGQAGADTDKAEQVGRDILIKQFQAFDLAAEALVAKVHSLAE